MEVAEWIHLTKNRTSVGLLWTR